MRSLIRINANLSKICQSAVSKKVSSRRCRAIIGVVMDACLVSDEGRKDVESFITSDAADTTQKSIDFTTHHVDNLHQLLSVQ